MKKIMRVVATVMMLSMFFACSESSSTKETTVVFADISWDSVQVHNRIVAFIIENGYEGYVADYMPGDTLPLFNGLTQGDVDVNMESWHSNFMEAYEKGINAGKIVNLGENMPDAPQGWYVPRYLIEGADALAPGLKSVSDLPKFAHLFKDPEDPSKGIVYGGVAGWSQLTKSEEIFNENNLEDTFNLGVAGSNAALAGSMAGAFAKKEPWIGYYWEPTAILGKLDMVRLPGTEYEKALVHILVNKDLETKAPEVVELLKNYSTSVAVNNQFLAEMDKNSWTTEEAAKWFLQNFEDVWTPWVSADVAEKVKAAL